MSSSGERSSRRRSSHLERSGARPPAQAAAKSSSSCGVVGGDETAARGADDGDDLVGLGRDRDDFIAPSHRGQVMLSRYQPTRCSSATRSRRWLGSWPTGTTPGPAGCEAWPAAYAKARSFRGWAASSAGTDPRARRRVRRWWRDRLTPMCTSAACVTPSRAPHPGSPRAPRPAR